MWVAEILHHRPAKTIDDFCGPLVQEIIPCSLAAPAEPRGPQKSVLQFAQGRFAESRNKSEIVGGARFSQSTARLFLKLTPASGRTAFLCLLTVHRAVGPAAFLESEGKPIFLPLGAIRAHCPYQKLAGNIIRLILPKVL